MTGSVGPAGATAEDGERLPVVAVGAGGMGRAWLSTLAASTEVSIVGIADIDVSAARRAAEDLGLSGTAVGTDAVALAQENGARAVIDVTVPEAHHPVTTAALFAWLPVLGEKPVADTLARALSLVAAAEVTGTLFMVSQSRRWNPHLEALRNAVAGLGSVGALTTEFFRGPHFGGFRDEMEQPLLVDMAIHFFDMARYLLAAEPVAVTCQSWNPSWSWYDGDAAAAALFEFENGARYGFTGSWCSPGAQTSWNGTWRVSGERGTASWDGEGDPVITTDSPVAEQSRSPYDGIAGSLAVFCQALRAGGTPPGEVHANVVSLAMVEAAVQSARTGNRVQVDDVLTRAWDHAVTDELRDDVRKQLGSWTSVRAALTDYTVP